MAELSAEPRGPRFKIDRVWAFALALPVAIFLLVPGEATNILSFALKAFGNTLPFILFAVLAVGYLKATGAEALLAKAFEGNQVRMIVLASLLGGLSPFCSCEVIPFIAALLAVGAPLAAVMAFWLSSPLMDPAMFAITSGELGVEFAVGKTVAAVGLGLLGGTIVALFANSAYFANPLKETAGGGGCGCRPSPFKGKPVWQFWGAPDRRDVFRRTVVENALFLGKWLFIAYVFEALMLTYANAEDIASILGGEGLWPIILGATVGAPAYLNGYAAVSLVDALLAKGMADGAAMSFVIAGGVTSIPAAVAVWALVKPRIFGAYVGIAIFGAILAGLSWSMVAT